MSETNTVNPLRQHMIEDIRSKTWLRASSTHTLSAATSTVASGSPLGSNARPIRQRPTRCADFSYT